MFTYLTYLLETYGSGTYEPTYDSRGYVVNNRGHSWQLDENGEVDIFALDVPGHNGPACVVCGYSFCHHCLDVPEVDCTAIDVESRDAPELLEASNV